MTRSADLPDGAASREGTVSRLIVYGSLAPGRENHERLVPLGGTWTRGFVEGDLVEGGWGSALGYHAFVWRPRGPRISAYLLCSPRLDEAAWRELDEFEGPAYRRIVVPFFGASGAEPIAWGQVYAAAERREIGS